MTGFTRHAADRARSRGIPASAIEAALEYGQHRARRGADFYTLGWRQVRECAEHGLDVSRWDGTEVVCCPASGAILTVYRNRNHRAMGAPRRDRRALHSRL